MENRKLYTLAFISSFVLGLISIMPGLIFQSPELQEGPGPLHPPGPGFEGPGFGRPHPGPTPLMVGSFFFVISIIIWTLNIELFRGIDNATSNRKVLRYGISYISILTITFCIIYFTTPPNGRRRHLPIAPFASAAILNTLVLLYLDSLLVKEKKRKVEEENARLREVNLMAQQQQLLNQLNPHFIFNSLSSVKSLVARNSEEAEVYLIRLSEFLRTTMNQSLQSTLELAEEIEFCEQYLSLQKLRFPKSLQYSVDIPQAVRTQYKLPIFTLQTLSENAIKHNYFTSSAPLRIQIKFVEPDLIEIRNNRAPRQNVESTGIGLKNLKERYALLGVENGIQIMESQTEFLVTLKLLKP